MWPASAQFKQQLLGDGHEASVGAAAAASGGGANEVFVGALPDGQLYALPRSPFTTFDFIEAPPHSSHAQGGGGGGGGAPGGPGGGILALPYREAAAVEVAAVASREVVAVHAEDGLSGADALITARWLEHCGSLWAGAPARAAETSGGGGEYQCLIGVQNVSAAVDAAVERRALPPGLQPPAQQPPLPGPPAPAPYVASAAAVALAMALGVPTPLVPLAAWAGQAAAAAVACIGGLWAIAAAMGCCRGGSRWSAQGGGGGGGVRCCGCLVLPDPRRMRPGRRGRGGRGGGGGGGGDALAAVPAPGRPHSQAPQAPSTPTAASATPAPLLLPEAAPATVVRGGVEHRVYGRLAVSPHVLGHGCHGTIVFAGEVRGEGRAGRVATRGLSPPPPLQVDARPVAVKRMLRTHNPAASREISLLIRSDGHPNVVRYFACEETPDFGVWEGRAQWWGAAGNLPLSISASSSFSLPPPSLPLPAVFLALERCEDSLGAEMAKAARVRLKFAKRAAAGRLPGGVGTPAALAAMGSGSGESDLRSLTDDALRALLTDESAAAASDSDSRAGGHGSRSAAEWSIRTGPLAAAASALVQPPVAVPSPHTRRFLRAMASALAHLHAHRIAREAAAARGGCVSPPLHPCVASASASTTDRDIKPANILLSRLSEGTAAAAPAPTQRLYASEREFHDLGGLYTPKISDLCGSSSSGGRPRSLSRPPLPSPACLPPACLPASCCSGLGKQLAVDASSYGPSTGGPARRGGGAGAGGSPKLGGGRDLDSAASSAAAPGSVGWQAPELLVSLLRERSPHDPLLQGGSPGGDSSGGGGGGGEDWADGAGGSQGGSPGGPQVRSSPEAPDPAVAAAACEGGQQGGSDLGPPAPSGAPWSQSHVDPRWRLTRAADVWSLGCVLFHVLDPGGHPFGETYEVRGKTGLPEDEKRRVGLETGEGPVLCAPLHEGGACAAIASTPPPSHPPLQRERNIIRRAPEALARLAPLPDAHDLVAGMLRPDPAARPTADEVRGEPPRLSRLLHALCRRFRPCAGPGAPRAVGRRAAPRLPRRPLRQARAGGRGGGQPAHRGA